MRAKPVPLNALLAERESTTHHPPAKGGEKMEPNPRDCGNRCRFDAFCKTVLKYNVPNSVDRLLKKRHPSGTLRETPFCRQPGAKAKSKTLLCGQV